MMEGLIGFLFIALISSIALLIAVRFLAIALHAFGGNPPNWLMEPFTVDQPRGYSLIFLVAATYLLASLFFELPMFDLFTERNGGGQ